VCVCVCVCVWFVLFVLFISTVLCLEYNVLHARSANNIKKIILKSSRMVFVLYNNACHCAMLQLNLIKI